MEEEEKVVEEQPVEEQPVEEQPAQPAPVEGKDPNKFSLITFILAVVAFCVCGAPVGGLAALIMGAICLKRVKVSNPNRKPFTIFDKISKPLGIVDLILGILSVLGWFIYFLVIIIMAIVAAVQGA